MKFILKLVIVLFAIYGMAVFVAKQNSSSDPRCLTKEQVENVLGEARERLKQVELNKVAWESQ